MKKTWILWFIIITLLWLSSCGNHVEFVTIGTWGITWVYYPTGWAISRLLNIKKDEYFLKATVESTAGSVYNINAVLNEDLEFGIAQSDRQYQAYRGLAEWEGAGAQTKLRSVFSIYPESVTLLVSSGSNIQTVEDLKEKKINLWNPGSGQLQNALDTLEAAGLKEEDIEAEYVKATEAPGLIQDERIDGFFYTVGHPNGNIKEATSGKTPMRIVPIDGEVADKLINTYPYYAKSIIENSLYPNLENSQDINTFWVKATLITSEEVDEEIVYKLTKEVFENLDKFRELHPAYWVITKENMLEWLTAPLHKWALKYFKEAWLDEYIDAKLIVKEK